MIMNVLGFSLLLTCMCLIDAARPQNINQLKDAIKNLNLYNEKSDESKFVNNFKSIFVNYLY